MKSRVPNVTVERLSIYSRALSTLEMEGHETVSSATLAEWTTFSAAQIRRDFAWFGQFGTRGKGYPIATLRQRLDEILGVHVRRKVALVGVGNLGSALLGYSGFKDHNFDVAVAFDMSVEKVGTRTPHGILVRSMDDLSRIVSDEGIEIAMIAVPAHAAQEVADRLVRAGIPAILNFAPTRLYVPDNVYLRNVDLSVELERLSYHLEHRSENG